MRLPLTRAQLAWAFYDWANSAYWTLIGTFIFAAYFTQAVASDVALGTAQWGYTLTITGLTVAILCPLSGAIADAAGRRKPWLGLTTLLTIGCCALLWFVRPDPAYVGLALVLVGLANIGGELSQMFYNAMLADIVPPDRIGRLSGWGWSLGYAGALVCLVLALLLFVQADPPLFGLDKETAEHVRIVGPLVAVWYAVFALPLFMFTPDRRATGRPLGAAVVQGVRTLRRTLMEVRRYRDTALYLVAHMLYADGLNTLFVFGAIYAAGTFGMDVAEVTLFGIVLNVTSGLGAFAFAWVDDWIGPKRTIILSLIGLVLCGTIALVAPDKAAFWVGASMIGIFLGPTQAASRSLMTRLSPPAMRTEMFGLYALSGKATAFVGPFLLSTVTLTFGNQRAGMATIIVFLLLGLGLLLAVREPPAEAAVLPAAA